MDNFFDDLKNNLEHRPEPEMKKSDWLAMQKKMKQENTPSRKVGGWWWMSLLLIPLLVSNGWFFLRLQKAEVLLGKLDIQKDTIHQTKIIYQTDTVYQTNTITEYIVSNNDQSSPTTYSQGRFLSKNVFQKHQFESSDLLTNNGFYSLNNGQSQNYEAGKNTKQFYLRKNLTQSYRQYFYEKNSNNNPTIEKNVPEKSIFVLLENLPSLNPFAEIGAYDLMQLTELEEVTVANDENKLKKRLRKIGYSLQPKSFQLGAAGGFAYPTNLNLGKREGYSASFYAATNFSENLRMWLEVAYIRLHLKSYETTESYGLPTHPLPDPTYIFEKASTDQHTLQYSAGMQYLFDVKKKWKPYVGIGYSILSILPHEVEYAYLDAPQGNEVILPREISGQDAIKDLWLLNVGLEYRLTNKWSAQLEGYYRGSWNDETSAPNILGLNTRLFYKF